MSFLSFLGRLLIATALVSSAYLHYSHPSNSIKEFVDNYNVIDALSNKHIEFDIPYDNANWAKIVKIFGGFEALVAILILSGDSLGGSLYLISLLVETLFLLWPKVEANSLHIAGAWRTTERQELLRLLCLTGVSLILISGKSNKEEKKTKK